MIPLWFTFLFFLSHSLIVYFCSAQESARRRQLETDARARQDQEAAAEAARRAQEAAAAEAARRAQEEAAAARRAAQANRATEDQGTGAGGSAENLFNFDGN